MICTESSSTLRSSTYEMVRTVAYVASKESDSTKDETWIKVGSMVAGLCIVETALVLGVDGAVIALGAGLLGVPVGYAVKAAKNGKSD